MATWSWCLCIRRLEWDPRCLSFNSNARPVLTASAAQVRQPIYDSSIGRWRNYAAQLQTLVAEIANGSSRAARN